MFLSFYEFLKIVSTDFLNHFQVFNNIFYKQINKLCSKLHLNFCLCLMKINSNPNKQINQLKTLFIE